MPRSGARARTPTSKRTWSFPLPGAAVRHGRRPVPARLGDQVAHDHRPRQRRDERVLALVAGVGLQRRDAELLGHLVAGVDHDGLDRAGGQRPGPDGVPVLAAAVGRLPDVDRDGHHLDALVLNEPAHGDGRIEAAAVGQYHPIRHVQSSSFPFNAILLRDDNAGDVAQAVRHRRAADVLVHDDEHRVVPRHRAHDLFQPAAIERRADDVGRARRRAQHHQVPRVRHLDHPLAEHAAQVVLRARSAAPAARAARRPSRPRAGAPSPRRGPRGRATPSSASPRSPCSPSSATSCAWLVTGCDSSNLVMRCWRWFLVSRLGACPLTADPSTTQARIPRMAVRRCAAWRQTSECGPSSTSSVISSPRCAGRQCRTTASGAAWSTSVVVDGEAREGGAGAPPAPPPGPCSSTRRCRATAAPLAAWPGSSVTCTVPPRPTRSPKACSSASSSPENV